MKLLQVVSLQNNFYNSNDDQISDLVKFNSSKFVHVSSLIFFIPECSTCSEESIDYKFVAIGFTEQKLLNKWCL
jgi:hypothetical protein